MEKVHAMYNIHIYEQIFSNCINALIKSSLSGRLRRIIKFARSKKDIKIAFLFIQLLDIII